MKVVGAHLWILALRGDGLKPQRLEADDIALAAQPAKIQLWKFRLQVSPSSRKWSARQAR